MFPIIEQWFKIGVLTNDFPDSVNEPPAGFRGKPEIDFPRCRACDRCAKACPTGAIQLSAVEGQPGERILSIDYGRCIFCGECEAACPDVIHLTREFQLATSDRGALVARARYRAEADGSWSFIEAVKEEPPDGQGLEEAGRRLQEAIRAKLGRSLHIREVDAGSCNGCEIEITALNNPVYDIERFGIHFVASPRHADMLLVTGPVTRNMEIALRQTYEATPGPKLVVAVGACAISGGLFGKSYASCGGVDNVVPVDVYIPGCPPRPEALLHGILAAIHKYGDPSTRPNGLAQGSSRIEKEEY